MSKIGGVSLASIQDRGFVVRAAAIVVSVVYLVVTTAVRLHNDSWPTPDFLIPPLILIAVFAGRGWRFVLDWAPFLGLILLYEGLRGTADHLNHHVHVQLVISAERWLTGDSRSLSNVLQDKFFHEDRVAWYDWAATTLYLGHFPIEMTVGFWLWIKGAALYWRYAVSILSLYFLGLVGYVAYPAAPPWMANDLGLIPPIERIFDHTLSRLHAVPGLVLSYRTLSANDVAAMPSLHAAMPLLLALVATRVWGKKALPSFAYPLLGGLAWIYLGEHWLMDVIAGWLLAIAVFVLVWKLDPRLPESPSAVTFHRVRERVEALPAWPLAIGASAFTIYIWIVR